MFKVLNWNLHSFWLLEIIQVLDSISWVRCASGNVFFINISGYIYFIFVNICAVGAKYVGVRV